MKNIVLSFLLLSIISCTTQQAAAPPVAAVKQATAELVSQFETVVGTWQGVLPCADCPGINYTLQVFPDQTYHEKLVYQDRSVEAVEQTGVWDIDASGVLNLEKAASSGMHKFKVADDALLMLDMEGEPIKSGFEDMYRLRRINQKKQGESNPQVWQEKYEQGIHFVAMGNEPFWNLEITKDAMMAFKIMEGAGINVSLPEPTRLQDANGMAYTAETEEGTLDVHIINSKCTDTMAGQEFPYTVSVKFDDEAYSGCGMYLKDNRLQNTWALQQMNGKEIDAKEFPRGVPVLDFNLQENRVSGSGGCNRISGDIEVKGDQLGFKPIASTKMACPNMQLEDDFLKVISENSFRYKITEGQLKLLKDDKPVLVFRKAD